MSGILRLSNDATGQSTLDTNATNDVTYSLPDTGSDNTAIILTDDAHEVTSINWDGIAVNIENGDINLDNGTLFIDSTNDRVGIGTTSPSSNLHIASSLATIRLEDSDVAGGASYSLITSSSNGNIAFLADPDNVRSSTDIRFSVDDSEAMRIDSSGRVGIGTHLPTHPLTVKRTIAGSWIQLVTDDTNASTLAIGTSPSNYNYIQSNKTESGTVLPLTFWGGSNRAVDIDSSGRVGIGTSSPAGRLEIKDNGYRQGIVLERSATTIDRGFIYIGDGTNSTVIDEIYLDAYNTSFHFRQGAAGTTETVTFKSDGKVGIGTTSPGADLGIGNFDGNEGIILQSGTPNAGYLYFADGSTGPNTYRGFIQYNHSSDSLDIGTASSTKVSIDSGGNVGIGITNPASGASSGSNRILNIASGITSGVSHFTFGDSNAVGKIESVNGNGSIAINATTAVTIGTGGSASERMRIDSAGMLIANEAVLQKGYVSNDNIVVGESKTIDIKLLVKPGYTYQVFGKINNGSGATDGHLVAILTVVSASSIEGYLELTIGSANGRSISHNGDGVFTFTSDSFASRIGILVTCLGANFGT